MQLLTRLRIGPLLNEFPNILYLLVSTRLKSWRIVEDEVASRICDLMLDIMHTSLESCMLTEGYHGPS